jgi:hypothetical protein
MPTNNFPGIGYSNNGFNRNFFIKYTVTETTFGGASVDGYQPSVIINLIGTTQTVMLLNEDATNIVEVSFNGNFVDEELNPTLPSRGLSYDFRPLSKIWFRLKSGSPGPAIVSVRAWSQY